MKLFNTKVTLPPNWEYVILSRRDGREHYLDLQYCDQNTWSGIIELSKPDKIDFITVSQESPFECLNQVVLDAIKEQYEAAIENSKREAIQRLQRKQLLMSSLASEAKQSLVGWDWKKSKDSK